MKTKLKTRKWAWGSFRWSFPNI